MRLFKELEDLKGEYEDIINDLNNIKGLFGKRRRRKYINNNQNTIQHTILYTIESKYSLKMYISTNNIISERMLRDYIDIDIPYSIIPGLQKRIQVINIILDYYKHNPIRFPSIREVYYSFDDPTIYILINEFTIKHFNTEYKKKEREVLDFYTYRYMVIPHLQSIGIDSDIVYKTKPLSEKSLIKVKSLLSKKELNYYGITSIKHNNRKQCITAIK